MRVAPLNSPIQNYNQTFGGKVPVHVKVQIPDNRFDDLLGHSNNYWFTPSKVEKKGGFMHFIGVYLTGKDSDKMSKLISDLCGESYIPHREKIMAEIRELGEASPEEMQKAKEITKPGELQALMSLA